MKGGERKMRICIIATYTTEHLLGGREIHIKELAGGLVKRGHKVTILTTKHPRGIKYENKKGVDIYHYPKSNPLLYRTGRYKDFIHFFQRVNREKRFDIVHDQATLLGISFIKYSKSHIPTVTTFHGTTYDELKSCLNVIRSNINIGAKIKSSLSICKLILAHFQFLPYTRRFDATIATSNEQVKIIRRWHFIPKDKIHKVFNGVDTDVFAPKPNPNITLRERYGVGKGDKIILTVSRLQEQKGIQNIIRAMPAILKEMKNAKLMVVGDGDYTGELKELTSRLGMEGNIIFTGTVPFEKLPYYFNACDVFVNPTVRQDGYDLTIIEAMACAKPVVVSNIGSVPTVVEHGVDGLLTPPGDVQALREGVVKVLSVEGLRKRMGKNARKKVVENFSLDRMVEDMIKVYEVVRLAVWRGSGLNRGKIK